MSGPEMNKNAIVASLIVLVGLFVVYQYDPSFFGLMRHFEGFEEKEKEGYTDEEKKPNTTAEKKAEKAGFVDKKANTKAGFKNEKDGFKDDEPKKPAMPEGFADLKAYEGTADFGSADAPAGCYPRDQLTPSELLPRDMNSIWAEQNPMGPGSLKGKNFLSAGALIGVNTVGQSLRNANLQVRSEPPNPQVAVSIFNQSTIAPDISHRPLEIGS